MAKSQESSRACLKPCRERPYQSASARGYFGGHAPEEYYQALSEESVVACHSRTQFSDSGVDQLSVCTGHVVAQIKSCKSPNGVNKQLVEAHGAVRAHPDCEQWKRGSLSIFDFKKHHRMEGR